MPAKRDPATARYRALRDVAVPAAEPGGQGRILLPGDTIDLAADLAADLVRDGMLTPEPEGT